MQLTEDNIADYSDTLVERVRAGGHVLDYSEASITLLENLVRISDDALKSPDLPQEHRDLVVFFNACYLGEVMARNLGGVWQFPEQWPDSSLTFRREDGTGVQIFPFQKLFLRVTEGAERHDLVDYYSGLKKHLALP